MKVTAESNWLRAMGRHLFKMAERPDRRRNNDLHTGLRELAFMAQALALQVEDEESFVLETEDTCSCKCGAAWREPAAAVVARNVVHASSCDGVLAMDAASEFASEAITQPELLCESAPTGVTALTTKGL